MSTETREATDLPAPRWRRDRIFFAAMATVIALVVFAGFSRTFFLKGLFGTRPLSLFFHIHGFVFSCWIILFIVQITLVATGRINVHRRLGIAGAILAVLMVVIGLMAAIDSARRGFTTPGGPPPLVFFVIPAGPLAFLGLTDLFVVACFVYDWIGRGRVHRAFLWGGLFIIVSQPVRFLIGGTAAWLAFARWLTG